MALWFTTPSEASGQGCGCRRVTHRAPCSCIAIYVYGMLKKAASIIGVHQYCTFPLLDATDRQQVEKPEFPQLHYHSYQLLAEPSGTEPCRSHLALWWTCLQFAFALIQALPQICKGYILRTLQEVRYYVSCITNWCMIMFCMSCLESTCLCCCYKQPFHCTYTPRYLRIWK